MASHNLVALAGGISILVLVVAERIVGVDLPAWARVGGGLIGGLLWAVVFLMIAAIDLVPDAYRRGSRSVDSRSPSSPSQRSCAPAQTEPTRPDPGTFARVDRPATQFD